VFEGLLPEPFNSQVIKLLFRIAHWHGLAKLRLHSDISLEILENETTTLGVEFRRFQTEVCPNFNTRELRKEAASRKRRKTKESGTAMRPLKKKSCKETEVQADTDNSEVVAPKSLPSEGEFGNPENKSRESGTLPKQFNLNSYKNHCFGDYASTIKDYGTTDSYSTEPVSRSQISLAWISCSFCSRLHFREN
jgi:hypothetical protein